MIDALLRSGVAPQMSDHLDYAPRLGAQPSRGLRSRDRANPQKGIAEQLDGIHVPIDDARRLESQASDGMRLLGQPCFSRPLRAALARRQRVETMLGPRMVCFRQG
jgi:hypothetical protein